MLREHANNLNGFLHPELVERARKVANYTERPQSPGYLDNYRKWYCALYFHNWLLFIIWSTGRPRFPVSIFHLWEDIGLEPYDVRLREGWVDYMMHLLQMLEAINERNGSIFGCFRFDVSSNRGRACNIKILSFEFALLIGLNSGDKQIESIWHSGYLYRKGVTSILGCVLPYIYII